MIRGAPAIGVAAAMGLALGALSVSARSYGAFKTRFLEMALRMERARPTAVNLRWAVKRMSRLVDGMADRSVAEIRAALRQESQKRSWKKTLRSTAGWAGSARSWFPTGPSF